MMKEGWDKQDAKFQVPSMKHEKVDLPKLYKLEGFGPPMPITSDIEVERNFPAQAIDMKIQDVCFLILCRTILQESINILIYGPI